MPESKKRLKLSKDGRKFLKELRLSNSLSPLFKKKYPTIRNWENEKSNPSIEYLNEYLKLFNTSVQDFINQNFVVEILPSPQEIATQKSTKISKDNHPPIIKEYLEGSTLEKISIKYSCTPSNIFYILKKYNIDTAKHGSGELYHFPESDYIKTITNQNITEKDALPLIASLLFTDGCLYKSKKGYEISYYGTDKTLHQIFADLIWYCFKIRPSSYMIGGGPVMRTRYINREVAEKMLELSPSYKTKPASKENWEEFLKIPDKPCLDFMKNYEDKIVNESIRLAMCADGCISISNKKDKIFFTLILACSHPNLVKNWSSLFDRVGIKNKIVKGCGKTGIGGVKGIEECISQFCNIGGFIEKVKVCVRHSPLYGIEKQRILFLANKLLAEHNRINTLPLKFKEFQKLL